MKIYTSYYKKIERDPRGLIPVRISTSEPKWFTWYCETIPELYPGWDLVNGIKSETLSYQDYERIYKERLKNLDRNEILAKLEKISHMCGDRDIVLLCYEVPEDFCHRHFVAEWLDCNVTELI